MKQIKLVLLLAFLAAHATVWAGATPIRPTTIADLSAAQLTSLAQEDVAMQLGRKLRPAERRQLRRARRLQQRHPEWSPRQALDAAKRFNPWAIAGFVLSHLPLLLLLFPFGSAIIILLLPILPFLGIVFSSIALYLLILHRGEEKGLGLAIAGLVMGIIGVLSSLVVMGLLSLFMAILLAIL